ncbi:MAG: hypothetical protein GY764_02165 [Halieaceae bacterium]|nr:hypothetical protein [Halieaceae bacterium]
MINRNKQPYTASFLSLWRLSIAAIFAAHLAASPANADSASAHCGFSGSRDHLPTRTSPCSFSQRQGAIGIYFEGGQRFNFTPVGDAPGNYRDEAGRPVYRQKGLGQEGQLFKLPTTPDGLLFLYVMWASTALACDAPALTTPGRCTLALQAPISFEMHATHGGSLNELTITPRGLPLSKDTISEPLEGGAVAAEIADLDANGWPEIYVFVSSAGSGSYGSLVAYAVNGGTSLTPVYLPALDETPGAADGYGGHDEFAIVENRLARRFPLYTEQDTNSAPSGGTRQIGYRLKAGEAGWILVPDTVSEY